VTRLVASDIEIYPDSEIKPPYVSDRVLNTVYLY
jgi:hypothetical protein